MIARATHTAQFPAPGSASLAGRKEPRPHRLYLSDGRVLEGDVHRATDARLADHLSTLKGFISITNAACGVTGAIFPYLAINLQHVLMIEELAVEEVEKGEIHASR